MPGEKQQKRSARKPAPNSRGGDPAVVVIGAHPAAWLCGILLHAAGAECAITDAGTTPNLDRLVTLNPGFFSLHKSLEPLRKSLKLQPVRQTRFLGPGGEEATSKAGKGDPLCYVVEMNALRDAVRDLALKAGVALLEGTPSAEAVDESGILLRVGRRSMRPKLLAVCDPMDADSAALLDIPAFTRDGHHVVQTTAHLVARGHPILARDADGPDTLVMTLDLEGSLAWGWLLRLGDEVQLCVQGEPGKDIGERLLDRWAGMLRERGVLDADASPDGRTLRTQPLPLGGALQRDVVARRAVLFGPAGGFYSASGEDVYPACWSAKFAADAAAKASKADHPQDALAAYRGKWGSTLGDYLRGPQQNLRFLLPLVYKNPPMTDRLANAIHRGESLVK